MDLNKNIVFITRYPKNNLNFPKVTVYVGDKESATFNMIERHHLPSDIDTATFRIEAVTLIRKHLPMLNEAEVDLVRDFIIQF